MVLAPVLPPGGAKSEMMEDRESKERRAAKWLLDALIKAALGSVVAFWVAYTVYEPFRASVWALVHGLAPLFLGVAGALGFASLGCVVFRYRRGLWEVIGCAGSKLRDGYIAVLWRLVVRPAREHFGLEASDVNFEQAAGFIDRFQPMLLDMDHESVALIARALARRKPGSLEAIVDWPELRFEADATEWPEGVERLMDACERLRQWGVIDNWVGSKDRRSESFFELKIGFPVAGRGAFERLHAMVEAEEAKRATGRGEAVEGEEPLDIVVRRLPWLARQLFAWMLEEYEPAAGDRLVWGAVREELGARGWSRSRIRREVGQACDQLKGDGLVSQWQYLAGDDDWTVEIRLAPCVLEAGTLRVREWVERSLAGF
jgi:hypothetical protein